MVYCTFPSLWNSVFFEIDLQVQYSPPKPSKNYFYSITLIIYRLQKGLFMCTYVVGSSLRAKFPHRKIGSWVSHLLSSGNHSDIATTYSKRLNQFTLRFLVVYFSISDIFGILTSNSGYSNPNILEPSFFCRAFRNLLKMVELIFSRITDASFSVFVDISISHLWFDRGETRASPIFSMQCLDMLRKTISNLFWVNWLSFGRDLSPGFSVAISCWHSSIIRFPPAKKRSPPRTPPFYEIFNSAFGT